MRCRCPGPSCRAQLNELDHARRHQGAACPALGARRSAASAGHGWNGLRCPPGTERAGFVRSDGSFRGCSRLGGRARRRCRTCASNGVRFAIASRVCSACPSRFGSTRWTTRWRCWENAAMPSACHGWSCSTRATTPALLPWLARRPLQAIDLADRWEHLLAVVQWIVCHPRPGIYLRQVDVPGVHSKFIEAHRAVLSELLDLALPPEAIDDRRRSASRGSPRRYGFLDKPARIRLRVLDAESPRACGCRIVCGHYAGCREFREPRHTGQTRVHHRERDQLPGIPAGVARPS